MGGRQDFYNIVSRNTVERTIINKSEEACLFEIADSIYAINVKNGKIAYIIQRKSIEYPFIYFEYDRYYLGKLENTVCVINEIDSRTGNQIKSHKLSTDQINSTNLKGKNQEIQWLFKATIDYYKQKGLSK